MIPKTLHYTDSGKTHGMMNNTKILTLMSTPKRPKPHLDISKIWELDIHSINKHHQQQRQQLKIPKILMMLLTFTDKNHGPTSRTMSLTRENSLKKQMLTTRAMSTMMPRLTKHRSQEPCQAALLRQR
jgi:hypothetical protein